MKRITTILTLSLAAIFFAGFSTTLKAQDAFGGISGAIQKGDAVALSAYLNANVEVTLPGVDQAYSANQAQFVLKDFFTKNKPTSFKISHSGDSGGTSYATGSYVSANGTTYDTNIFVKNVGGKMLITQIRFEAD